MKKKPKYFPVTHCVFLVIGQIQNILVYYKGNLETNADSRILFGRQYKLDITFHNADLKLRLFCL